MTGSVVIVGDGWAAWSTAAALARAFRDTRTITVVPVPADDPVALATDRDAPHWLSLLGLDTRAVIAEADATFRLGTAVHDGDRSGFVPMADAAPSRGMLPFDQLGLGPRAPVDPLEGAALAGRLPVPLPAHGFHLDIAGYRRLLRRHALRNGVVLAAPLADVERRPDAAVSALRLEDGCLLSADLFIDASGEASRLIDPVSVERGGQAMRRFAVHVRDRPAPPTQPMTRVVLSHASDAAPGWTTALPLRTKVVELVHRVQPGEHRRLSAAWSGNVVALGSSFGTVDGAEGGDWALVQKGVTQLIQLMPDTQPTSARQSEYNGRMAALYDQWAMAAAIRQGRLDPAMPMPPALLDRMALYSATGRMPASDVLAVPDVVWTALMDVHGIAPRRRHPLAPREEAPLGAWRATVARRVADAPLHVDVLAEADPR